MIKGSTILLLGAGQIGRAACVEILKREPKTLYLHCLTDQESQESVRWIKNNVRSIRSEMIPCCGDVLVGRPMQDADSLRAEIDYRFGVFDERVYQTSQLWRLIEDIRPDMILDGINTATVIGYGHDPYTTSRELRDVFVGDRMPDAARIMELIAQSLLSEAIPQLVRFTQVLYKAMMEFGVHRYVKISTSGLGGMGFNIPYTHGDPGEPCLSIKLLGKVASAGILNQLLWTLSHTPGIDIKVIVPTALVGWEGITTDIKSRSKGTTSPIPMYDCEQPLDLSSDSVFTDHQPIELQEPLNMVGILSGENDLYGIGDITTITTLGQMGCITKEEVGVAAAEALDGNSRYDICSAMDTACLGPSFKAAFHRQSMLATMNDLDREMNGHSVAIGNLGPRVTKHLWELEILRMVAGSLRVIAERDPVLLAQDAEHLILHQNPPLRRKILSVKMPILLEGNRILLGAQCHVPGSKADNGSENMETWAEQGWVDIRAGRMRYWQDQMRFAMEMHAKYSESDSGLPLSNWESVSLNGSFDVGEVLGFIYTINGGNRKEY